MPTDSPKPSESEARYPEPTEESSSQRAIRAKLKEFRALLAPAGWQVIGLSEAAIERDVAETGSSFAENARLKALGYSTETELPVLADDSGLEVFALGGKPGVRSARYAGPDASDADRVRKLLLELETPPWKP